jgi:flagellar hook assembly protein FlgD
VRRLPVAAFMTLAVATIAAFFVTQHLKVSTPLLAGFPAPYPAAINPVDGRVCQGVHGRPVSHRTMQVSFYLLNRSDSVDVYVVDQNGTVVDTIASGVPMRASPPVRQRFSWNGRTSSGTVAPDGTYYIRVSLIHQGRSVLISDNAGALPVTVETVPPRPKVTGVTPHLIPRAGVSGATIRYTGNHGVAGRILVYRTDLPGPPRLVKSFPARRGGTTPWDGTLAHGVPAPQGTYLIGVKVTDKACNTGVFPAEFPPVPGTTAHAGVTVRYLAALPPLEPVAAGRPATVYVDARQHSYAWALRAVGTKRVLASGRSRAFALRVPVPSAAGTPGLYELALRYGSHRTLVPLIGTPAGGTHARVLVVLPALTWQGLNPVDDDGDGIPNTLSAGYPVLLARPLVDGLPAGWGSLTGLLARLRKDHLSYALTTDLALLNGTGPRLAGHAGVVLAGDERWVPPALAAALRGYVISGGNLLSLGIDSLRRNVIVAAGRAHNPSAPRAADIFGAHSGPLTATRGALILAGKDELKLFTGTSGAFRGFSSYQPFTSVTLPLTIASAAGTTTSSSAIIGFRLGRGTVIEIGIPGFGAALARKFDAQQILSRIWTVLSR